MENKNQKNLNKFNHTYSSMKKLHQGNQKERKKKKKKKKKIKKKKLHQEEAPPPKDSNQKQGNLQYYCHVSLYCFALLSCIFVLL